MRLILVLPLLLCACLANYPQDPYATLGLRRGASIRDIKKAYKSLAKEWHPDKNSDPKANEKFVNINKAYEVLSDPLRKERFDKFGAFDDSPPDRHDFHFQGFDSFFNGFGSFDHSDSIFHKQKISMRMYSHTILEKSNTQPFILYAYSGYCQSCYRLEPIWKAIIEDLEPLGYGIGTINAVTDMNLLEKLRVTHLPTIMVLVEGRVIHYRASLGHITTKAVRVWARDVLPQRNYLTAVNSHQGLKKFVDQWKASNKVSVLVLSGSPEPRLRYLLTAMKYSATARFAYVNLADPSDEINKMKTALSIHCIQCENIIVFNDFPERGPVVRQSKSHTAGQLTVEAMTEILEQNKFLVMPRLSSNVYLDELCPVSSRSPRKLCAILIVRPNLDGEYVDSFRNFAAARFDHLRNDYVTLSYIYATKQSGWLLPFLPRGPPSEDATRDILVLWRFEHVKARFVLLRKAWTISGSDVELDNKLSDVVRNVIRLEDVATVGNLADEYAPSMWTKMARSFVRMMETLWFHATKEETLPVLSIVGTILCIFAAYYFINNWIKPEGPKKRRLSPESSQEWHPEDPKLADKQALHADSRKLDPALRIKKMNSIMEPLIHELRAESYFGMVRLLKPGCRSIILLVDQENKQALLERFACYVFPLRNNKTFSFGYLIVEKNLQWFRKLLEHTLPMGDSDVVGPSDTTRAAYVEQLKSINPRQTVGTVLVLCGYKLYFSIYHPMHNDPSKKHFLGFDDDGEDASDASSDEECLTESAAFRRAFKGCTVGNVLNGFGNWLDHLLEGSVQRYYLPEWPDNLR